MSLVPDEYWYNQIANHIRRCDAAWENSEYFPQGPDGSPNYSRLEQIAGDVQRTIATSILSKATNTSERFTLEK